MSWVSEHILCSGIFHDFGRWTVMSEVSSIKI